MADDFSPTRNDAPRVAGRSFPKSLRLLKRREFLAMREGASVKIRSRAFLIVAKANRLGHNRLGVTITGKVAKATERARFKRQAREFFRTGQGDWAQGFDFLFIAQSAFAETGNAELRLQFQACRARLSALGGGRP